MTTSDSSTVEWTSICDGECESLSIYADLNRQIVLVVKYSLRLKHQSY